MVEYPFPLSKLLKIGFPEGPWPNYVSQYELTREHIPQLIEMATDAGAWEDDSATTDAYRNIHAWRALGQLGAVEAIEPLLPILRWVDEHDDDWASEDLPLVFGMFGEVAISPLINFAANPENGDWARVTAMQGLEDIFERHPETGHEIANGLMPTLILAHQNTPLLNGEIALFFATLKDPETYSLVEETFQAGLVDETVMGDWEDFKVEVGLLEKRITPLKNRSPFMPEDAEEKTVSVAKPKAKQDPDKKKKTKEKQAKASRKKNRKKK